MKPELTAPPSCAQMKELLAKLLDDDEDMLDLHLSAKAAEADARTAALQRLSLDASRPAAANGAVSVSIRCTKCVPCIRRPAACAALPAESTPGRSRVSWLLRALMARHRAAELRTSCLRRSSLRLHATAADFTHFDTQEPPATPRHEQDEDEARARSEEALDYVEQLLEAYFMQVNAGV